VHTECGICNKELWDNHDLVMDSTITDEPGTIAFILYRQHHQAAVVAQHPGLPNPEISKILGEQWRNLPAQTKKKWQALAEVRSTFVP
jgi:hypothetical protein